MHLLRRAYLLVASVLGVAGGEALASDKVSSPTVKKDRLELEYRYGYDVDSDPSLDREQAHKFVANYGLTDRLRPEFKAIFVNVPGREFELAGTEQSLRWQFYRGDEGEPNAAIEGNYKIGVGNERPDRFEVKLLASQQWDKWTAMINLGVEHEIGGHRDDGVAVKPAAEVYRTLNNYVNAGLELHGDSGLVEDSFSYSESELALGPVFHGNIEERYFWEAGYLFGINDNAPDGRFKLLLTHRSQF